MIAMPNVVYFWMGVMKADLEYVYIWWIKFVVKFSLHLIFSTTIPTFILSSGLSYFFFISYSELRHNPNLSTAFCLQIYSQ